MKPIVKKLLKKKLAEQAREAALEQLPVDQKTLSLAVRLLEPKRLKHIALAVVGGTAAVSLAGTLGEMRMYRRAVARELKKQLRPIEERLETLEAQNKELKKQNEELKQLARK